MHPHFGGPPARPQPAPGPEAELARYPMQSYAHHVAIAGPNTSPDDANSRAWRGATGYDVGTACKKAASEKANRINPSLTLTLP